MKKFILILLAFAIGLTSVIAQTTTARYATPTNNDNTGRALNYKTIAYRDTTGADSLVIKPNAYETLVKLTMKDSLTLGAPTTTGCYFGDKIIILLISPSGTPKLKFSTYLSKWNTAGTATMSTGLRGAITLIFDGAKWVETSRAIR